MVKQWRENKNLGKKILLVWNFHPTLHPQCQSGTWTTDDSLKVGTPTFPGIWSPSISKQVTVRVLNTGLTTTNMNNFFQFFLLQCNPSHISTNFPPSFSFWSFPNFCSNDCSKPQIHTPFSDKITKTSFRPLQNCKSAVTPLQTHLMYELHPCHSCHTVASQTAIHSYLPPSEVSVKNHRGVWGKREGR